MIFPFFRRRPTPHDHARALGTLGGKVADTGGCFAPRFRPFGIEPLRVSPVPASIAFAGVRNAS